MKYTKKEFGLMLKIATKNVSNYITRGNVVLTGDKIDGDLETNKYFIEKRLEFLNKKEKKSGPPPPAGTDEQKLNDRTVQNAVKDVQPQFNFPTENPGITKNSQLDIQIKEASLQKEEINTKLLKARLDKISGDLIPTELVKNLFVHHSKSITVAFQQGAEGLLTQIAKLKGIDISELAQLRVELIEIINTSVNNSIEISKKTVSSIVAEHSQKKEVGEHQ